MQRNIVYFITIIILVTLAIQAYWNIKNYEANKITVNNEVLAALNNSVDTYYTNLAKSGLTPSIITQDIMPDSEIPENIRLVVDSVLANMDTNGIITVDSTSNGNITVMNIDSSGKSVPVEIKGMPGKANVRATGTLKSSGPEITELATKIIVSISSDSIDLKGLTKYLDKELKRKGFTFNYALSHIQENKKIVNYGNPNDPEYKLSVASSSAYLPSGSKLVMHYPNINLIALKEGFAGILLSLLFTIAIITSLLYLLKIIKQQKQIVLSKNDFISNISHELKTPIATSLSALEAIQHFNASNDSEKTEKYMGIASQQLQKLNVMVEKILDTASLESKQLTLQKEMVDIIPITKNVLEKHQMNTPKNISFETESNILLANIDAFHFENVINNIVENAIKYGGNTISVRIIPGLKHAVILIADDGTPIDKSQRNKVFDKFYRISTNNRHDVKGYGIGLYYSKNIIEKHRGKLTLEDDSKQTVFKITVPYV